MAKMHGSFVWHELMTSDLAAAAAFYGKVFGWTCKDSGTPGMDYRIFSAGEHMVAGMFSLDHIGDKNIPPNWSGYIGVDDVDAAAHKLRGLGGKVGREPADIPNVGRFSVVEDPQGAMFVLFQPMSPPPGAPPAPGTPGLVSWNELYALDIDKVWPFYAEMFGWTKLDAIDMGPMGKYQMFSNGAHPIGGMMNKPAQMPRPFWDFYVEVPDIDAAAAAVTAGGARIVNGPMQVPGGQWVAQGFDPQGAFFAFVGNRK